MRSAGTAAELKAIREQLDRIEALLTSSSSQDGAAADRAAKRFGPIAAQLGMLGDRPKEQ